MKRVILSLVCGLSLAASTHIQAKGVDIEKGRDAFETCRGCHSTPNYSNVAPVFYVPKIGGQRKAYLASALNAYKHEKRARTSMLANAYDMDDKTIEAISLYIEQNPGDKSPAAYTGGDAAKGKKLAAACTSCHTKKLDDEATAPILAGQHGNYLVKVMKDYQSGVRKDAVMQGMVANFSEDQLKDIAAYFADMESLSIVE